jgi:nucleoside-diphosphate-sugar epimerase
MRVTVFGASGKAGLLVCARALEDGHTVAAYARTPAKVTIEHDSLDVIRGELDDADAIRQAVTDSDAVISLLGPRPRQKGTPISSGTNLIIDAMAAAGVRRLLATATPSAPDPLDRSSVPFSIAVRMVRTMTPSSYRDIVITADAIRRSDLDWTVTRLPMLTDRLSSLPPAVGYVGSPTIRLFWLSRSVLADFLVGQLADDTWVRKAPVISNRR